MQDPTRGGTHPARLLRARHLLVQAGFLLGRLLVQRLANIGVLGRHLVLHHAAVGVTALLVGREVVHDAPGSKGGRSSCTLLVVLGKCRAVVKDERLDPFLCHMHMPQTR
eukprot:scaffold19235_cov61-Phaeocystis_antarctica.AAC.2